MLLNWFSADASSHHNSLWKWILMPSSYYSNNRGKVSSTTSSGSPTTRYPYSTRMNYPYNNGYFSSYNPSYNPSNPYSRKYYKGNTYYNRYGKNTFHEKCFYGLSFKQFVFQNIGFKFMI